MSDGPTAALDVLHVTNWYAGAWESGGVARYSYEVTRRLAASHDVTVFTTDAFRTDTPTERPTDVDGVETYYFRNASTWLAENLLIPTPYELLATLWRRIDDFDVVHIHEHRSPTAAAVARAARRAGVPYLIQPHGSLPSDTGRRRLNQLFDHIVGDRILQDAAGYLALHETEAEQLAAHPSMRTTAVEIVGNGFAPPTETDPESAADFRAATGIDPDAPTALYVGRLAERKGVDELVRAADHRPDYEFLVIGPDHGLGDELVTLAADRDNVHILGFVPENRKLAAYRHADAFVLPTRTGEGLPTAVLEALYYGCPVVATPEANVGFLTDYGVGRIVRGDATAFAAAVETVVESETAATRPVIEQEFSWDGIVADLEAVYADVIE